MSRRADGALELEVLQILWAATEPLQATDVQAKLKKKLAYTSVATVLSRLCAKGLLSRTLSGRSYAYEPTVSHDDWYAGRMLALLSETPDHRQLLAGFIDKLSSQDLAALRNILNQKGKR